MGIKLVVPCTPALPDALMLDCSNGTPARGSVVRTLARELNAWQHAGRPLGGYWARHYYPGTLADGSDVNTSAYLRLIYPGTHSVKTSVDGVVGYMPAFGVTAVGQGVSLWINSVSTLSPTTYDAATAPIYPTSVRPMTIGTSDVIEPTGTLVDVQVGSETANGPKPVACLLYEAPQSGANDDADYALVDEEKWGTGQPVTASAATLITGINRLRDRYRHAWATMRPVIAWMGERASANGVTVAGTDFRYVHDDTIGDGGTTPTDTGPGITVPLYQSAPGRSATVRVRVLVYAQATAGDTGEIGVAHLDPITGAMSTTVASLSPALTVTTTLGWHGTATPCYFYGSTAWTYDRVVLCAKASDASGAVTVRAWAMWPEPI